MKPNLNSLAGRLIQARKRLGLSQAEVAKACDLNQTALSNYERGKRRPDHDTLEMLGKVLKESPAWLAFGEDGLGHAVRSGAVSRTVFDAVARAPIPDDAREAVARLIELFLDVPPIFREYLIRRATEVQTYTKGLSPFVRRSLLHKLPEGEHYRTWEQDIENEFRSLRNHTRSSR